MVENTFVPQALMSHWEAKCTFLEHLHNSFDVNHNPCHGSAEQLASMIHAAARTWHTKQGASMAK
eukprot:5094461-Amphidinium_carterae.1